MIASLAAVLGTTVLGRVTTDVASATGTVQDVAVSVSPPTTSAQEATYTLNVVATDGIGPNSNYEDITIVAPNGTNVNAATATLTNNIDPAIGTVTPSKLLGNSSNTVYLGHTQLASAGDSITIFA